MYQVTEELPQVQVKVLVVGEQQEEINMSGWIQLAFALVVVIVLGYWLFWGEDI
jgi:hypothetical protein